MFFVCSSDYPTKKKKKLADKILPVKVSITYYNHNLKTFKEAEAMPLEEKLQRIKSTLADYELIVGLDPGLKLLAAGIREFPSVDIPVPMKEKFIKIK